MSETRDCLSWCYVFVPLYGDYKVMLGKTINTILIFCVANYIYSQLS